MPSLIDVRRRIRAVRSTLQLTKAMKMVERKYAFIAGSFAEIVTDRVSALAPVAERAEDIDLARALMRLQVSTRQPRMRG